MKLAAVADVHSPKFLEDFVESLTFVDAPDIFLFAGDMVNFGRASQYLNIIQAIDSSEARDVPVIACFGNEEFEAARKEILSLTEGRILFLDGESTSLEIAGSRIGVIGATAPVDIRGGRKRLNKMGLREFYESRAESLANKVKETAAEVDCTILLMHYSPLSERVNDNDISEYSWWMSKIIEDVQPDIVIHGHLHMSDRLETKIGKTRIVNVAFPAVGKITEIVL
ncbi:MAG: metallophosphoesterase [Candidatus Thorarchaeota archaeon]